jgi:hypothetical protein
MNQDKLKGNPGKERHAVRKCFMSSLQIARSRKTKAEVGDEPLKPRTVMATGHDAIGQIWKRLIGGTSCNITGHVPSVFSNTVKVISRPKGRTPRSSYHPGVHEQADPATNPFRMKLLFIINLPFFSLLPLSPKKTSEYPDLDLRKFDHRVGR